MGEDDDVCMIRDSRLPDSLTLFMLSITHLVTQTAF